MDTTALMYGIFEDFGLRRRIEAVVRNLWWNDGATDPTLPVPVDALAWAVATNATIQGNVANFGTVGDSIADATDAISDNDLIYIVTNALPRLGLSS